jgi:hypothetical protein
MERSFVMKIKAKRGITIFYSLFIIGGFILLGAASSFAGNKITGNEGETGYTAIKSIDNNFLTIDEGRFRIVKETKVYNQDGLGIGFGEIKKSSTVSVTYRRNGGDLIALEIMVKTPPKEKLPE